MQLYGKEEAAARERKDHGGVGHGVLGHGAVAGINQTSSVIDTGFARPARAVIWHDRSSVALGCA